jgi:hypothetical protein
MLQECGTSEGVWEVFLYSGTSALEWKVANGGSEWQLLALLSSTAVAYRNLRSEK